VPSYSPRAARALALLKRHYNDVDIFVEDRGNHNMWLLVVRRLLPAGTHISSVNMLGGRDAVEQACRLDQADTGRKKLYITDGDFDWLLGIPKRRLKYMYRLRSYSIEGVLISEASLVQLGLESCPAKNEAQVAADLNFTGLEAEATTGFKGLFVAYAVAHRLARRIRTVGYPVGNLFLSAKTGPTICALKVFNRARSVYGQAVRLSNLVAVRTLRSTVIARARALSVQQSVSGKDYLLPFVMKRFKAACGYNGSPEQFKVALARHFDPAMEPYLARRLRNLSR
jgi:hypothetical protein